MSLDGRGKSWLFRVADLRHWPRRGRLPPPPTHRPLGARSALGLGRPAVDMRSAGPAACDPNLAALIEAPDGDAPAPGASTDAHG